MDAFIFTCLIIVGALAVYELWEWAGFGPVLKILARHSDDK